MMEVKEVHSLHSISIVHGPIKRIFKQIYLTYRWYTNSYYNLIREDQEVMALKEYPTLQNKLEPHHQMKFSAISRTSWISERPFSNGFNSITLNIKIYITLVKKEPPPPTKKNLQGFFKHKIRFQFNLIM